MLCLTKPALLECGFAVFLQKADFNKNFDFFDIL